MEILRNSSTNRITLRLQNDVLEVLKRDANKRDLTLNAIITKNLIKNITYDENVNVIPNMMIPHDLFLTMVEKMKDPDIVEIAKDGPRIVKKIFDIMGLAYDIDHVNNNYFAILGKYCNWFEFSCKITGTKYRLVFSTGSSEKWSKFLQHYIRTILESLKIIITVESSHDGIIIFEFLHKDY